MGRLRHEEFDPYDEESLERYSPLRQALARNRHFALGCHIVSGAFTPILAKHTKSFNLIDTLSAGVDRIQWNFEPLVRQVETWRKTRTTERYRKAHLVLVVVDGKLEAPRSLLPDVHRLYFEPQYPDFSARTMWSLSNASTSACKKLDPIPQFKATAQLGGYLSIWREDSKWVSVRRRERWTGGCDRRSRCFYGHHRRKH